MWPRRHSLSLELCDEVAVAVGGRKSPGDSTGRGRRPAERHTTVLVQEALHPWLYCPCPPGPESCPLDWTCPSSLDLRRDFLLPGAQAEMGHLVSMTAQPFLKLWEEAQGQRTGGSSLPVTTQGHCLPLPATLFQLVGRCSRLEAKGAPRWRWQKKRRLLPDCRWSAFGSAFGSRNIPGLCLGIPGGKK